MSRPHPSRLTPAATACAAFIAAILLCSPANVGASDSEESEGGVAAPPPTQLTTYLMDVADESVDSEEEEADDDAEGGDGGPATEEPFEVIQSSLIVLDPTALNAINPHITADVEEMPIVRMELFSDLVIDVEFLNAKPRWTFAAAESENEEEGGSGIVPVEDGFLIRGTILPPHSGYVVLRARDAGVYGAVSVDGVGRFELWRAGEPLHSVNKVEYAEFSCGVEEELAEQATAMMGGLDGGCSMPTGCPGGCDDGCTIDVMMLYTTAVEQYYAGGQGGHSEPVDVEEIIEIRVDEANSIIVDSEIMSKNHDLLRIVYIDVVDYDEDGQTVGEVNGELSDPFSSEFVAAHAMRNALRADLVQLWVSGTIGEFAGFAGGHFSTVRSHHVLTVAHEFGHNFGLRHDRLRGGGCTCTACPNTACYDVCNDCDCGSSNDTAYGWHFTVAQTGQPDKHYRTIMAYDTAFQPGTYSCCFPSSTRVEYFSNPGLDYPEGNQPSMGSDNCADSALTIRGDVNHFGTRFDVARNRSSHDTTDTTFILQSIGSGPCWEPTLGDMDSEMPSISATGHDIALANYSTNLPGIQKNNSARDVFYFDRESSTYTLVSHAFQAGATTADGDSFRPAISADRRRIVFASTASDIVDDPPTVSGQHIYLYTRGRIDNDPRHALISRSSGEQGAIGNGPSDRPAVSHDGQFIAFQSEATNLVADDNNNEIDIFIRDQSLNDTFRVSVHTDGSEGNSTSEYPAISADGVQVVFESMATNLVDNDTNGFRDIFIHNIVTSETERVSSPHPGHNDVESNGDSFAPSISADGNRIAFHSEATNLVDPSITIHSGHSNVYVYDRAAEEMILVSECVSGGASGTQSSMLPSISPDGRFVAFLSYAKNLLEGENCTEASGLYRQVLIRDLEEGVTHHISVDDQGQPANASCHHVSISNNGRFVSYSSLASNLTPEADGNSHIFVRDRGLEAVGMLGDLNGDGVLDSNDVDILVFNFCRTDDCCVCCAADLNGDGKVDDCDLEYLCDRIVDQHQACGISCGE